MPTIGYTRGTKTHKITTAALQPGDRVLTMLDRRHPQTGQLTTEVAAGKTGALVRTVERLDYGTTTTGWGRKARRYRVTFDDGYVAGDLAPIQTWTAVSTSG